MIQNDPQNSRMFSKMFQKIPECSRRFWNVPECLKQLLVRNQLSKLPTTIVIILFNNKRKE